jgi:hypothetical protein
MQCSIQTLSNIHMLYLVKGARHQLNVPPEEVGDCSASDPPVVKLHRCSVCVAAPLDSICGSSSRRGNYTHATRLAAWRTGQFLCGPSHRVVSSSRYSCSWYPCHSYSWKSSLRNICEVFTRVGSLKYTPSHERGGSGACLYSADKFGMQRQRSRAKLSRCLLKSPLRKLRR